MKRRATSNFEQEATYLAIVGAASEVLGDVAAARRTYSDILRLQLDVDNRRGINWSRRRIVVLEDPVPTSLLRDLLRHLYPNK